jgi:hypothetical protein
MCSLSVETDLFIRFLLRILHACLGFVNASSYSDTHRYQTPSLIIPRFVGQLMIVKIGNVVMLVAYEAAPHSYLHGASLC